MSKKKKKIDPVPYGVLARDAWPSSLRHPAVKGVFVGGCVERGVGSSYRRVKAHTHIGGPYCGWICFLSRRWLDCEPLLLHELAHAVTRERHVRTWREYLLAIGGTIKAVKGVMANYEQDHDS